MPVTGWPLRAGRPAFGPTMRDERPTVDSSQEVNADVINLSFWQLGAIGLAAPKAVMYFDDNEVIDFESGYFAWDNAVYQDFPGLPSYVDFTINGAGDYTIEFDPTVLGRPDEEGVQQMEVLDFQFALADVSARFNTTQRLYAEVTQTNSQTFNVFTRRVAGLVNEPFAIALF